MKIYVVGTSNKYPQYYKVFMEKKEKYFPDTSIIQSYAF